MGIEEAVEALDRAPPHPRQTGCLVSGWVVGGSPIMLRSRNDSRLGRCAMCWIEFAGRFAERPALTRKAASPQPLGGRARMNCKGAFCLFGGLRILTTSRLHQSALPTYVAFYERAMIVAWCGMKRIGAETRRFEIGRASRGKMVVENSDFLHRLFWESDDMEARGVEPDARSQVTVNHRRSNPGRPVVFRAI